MKLIKFTASNVYGFLNFNIVFNEDLSFLTGSNGSGKTTVIRLIQALLTASASELNLIQFKNAELLIRDKDKQIAITAINTEDTIDISVTDILNPLHLPKIDPEEVERRTTETSRNTDIFDEITVKISSTEVFKFLSSLESPIILGLERRMPNLPLGPESSRFIGHPSVVPRRRMFRGTLGISLNETIRMVQEAYRRIRQYQDRQNQILRDNIFLSMFNYTTLQSVWEKKREQDSWSDQLQIVNRKKEIETSLAGLMASKEDLSRVMDAFFDQIELLFSQMENNKKEEVNIDWLINKAQIDRIVSIVKIVDKHRRSMDKYMAPFNLFKEAINGFYLDSHKTIDIDAVGYLYVNREDGKNTSVEALSSGERQLLILFAHLMFNRFAGKRTVFIIDEPELSLHLKWQEMFIDQILKLSPDTQFILATHSPEIVGDNRSKCISVLEERK